MEKRTAICCNELVFVFHTESVAGYGIEWDPLGISTSCSIDSEDIIIGENVLKCLEKSRFIDPDLMKKDKKLYEEFEELAYYEGDYFKEFYKNLMKEYEIKGKRKLYENMQSCSVKMNSDELIITPSNHDRLEGWSGFSPPKEETKHSITKNWHADDWTKFIAEYQYLVSVKLPINSSPEIIGAAVKLGIGRCIGRGSELVRSILFPNGMPDTLDEYLKQLGYK